MFAGGFAPRNWAFCDGQTLSISQNNALFSLLGTTFGGNGTTTFNLPDLQGRVPVSMGQGPGLNPYVLGQSGGGEQISLTVANLPPHTHAVAVDNGAPNSPTRTPATNTYLATTPRNEAPVYSSGSPTVALGAGTVGNIGSALPVSIVQPSLCVTFIVALAGIFPSRN